MGWENGARVGEGAGINLEPEALLKKAKELREEATKAHDPVSHSALEGYAEWYEKQASYDQAP